MTSSEIFSRCLPKSPSLIAGIGGKPDLTWEDVMASLRGVKKSHEGFIRYVYMDDPRGRGDFFAGLITEAFSRDDVRAWVLQNPKQIESLVSLAMREWKYSRHKYSSEMRAFAFGVKPQQWRRRYATIYSAIVGIPTYWEDTVLQKVRKQLKNN